MSNGKQKEAIRPPSTGGAKSYSELAENLDPSYSQDVSPEKMKQVQTVNATLTDMLYHPDGKEAIKSMLKQAPPEQSIPMATNTIFMKFEDMSKQGGKGEVPLDVKLAGGVHLFSEVVEMAEDLGIIPEDTQPEQLQPLMKQTFQQYIQRGLKDGSMDVIELQQAVEPLLTGEEREIGLHFASAMGTPTEMQQTQASESMFNKRSAPLRVELEGQKKQNQQMTQALQGMANAPEQDQGQGGMA